MSSMITPQGVVLATAMAVSGTVFLLVLRLQKSLPGTQFPGDQIPQSPPPILRSCISTGTQTYTLHMFMYVCMHIYVCIHSILSVFGNGYILFIFSALFGGPVEEKKKKKKKKRVQFAEDVVDPSGDGEEYRRQHAIINKSSSSSSSSTSPPPTLKQRGGMPENRVALYNGILRDRVVHRLAYSC
jgi:hypothetical protein